MKLLEERIRKDGIVKPGNVLKVDSFLNHQMDIELFSEMGKEFKRLYEGCPVNKILTIEASGIGIACVVAQYFHVPVVFAKKKSPKTIQNALSTLCTHSLKIVIMKSLSVPISSLQMTMFFSWTDFLAYGNAALGIIDLIKQSGANLVGMGFIIEKAFQNGRKKLEEQSVRVESLAIIEDLSNCCIKIKDE